MFKRINRSEISQTRQQGPRHRIEHWYVDNQIYFITARCRDRFPAFASERAKAVFWDRFDHYTRMHTFTPCVTTLMDNHYHTLGHLKSGIELKEMMRKLHGSVAKLVNDALRVSFVPFWRETKRKNYFDGCIRDEKQARLAYRYTLTQSVRHRLCADWHDYPHTHVNVELELMVRRALTIGAFLEGVPYKRYQKRRGRDA